tara:strand:- start:1087 stop:1869 length:783 start_codon:yes stop_codon:yes gene_type:complete
MQKENNILFKNNIFKSSKKDDKASNTSSPMSSAFNERLAYEMYGVSSESDLRDALYGTRTDLTEPEYRCIIEHLKKFDNPAYLEIGVYFGGNFTKVLSFLEENNENFKAVGVDLFESLLDAQNENQTHDIVNKWNILNVAFKDDLERFLKGSGFTNFEFIQGNSDRVVASLDQKFDVFFIDGNHTFDQTLKDANACIEKSKKGSFLIFHNASDNMVPDPQYVKRDGGPWKVCEQLKNSNDLRYVGLFDRCAVFEVLSDRD